MDGGPRLRFRQIPSTSRDWPGSWDESRAVTSDFQSTSVSDQTRYLVDWERTRNEPRYSLDTMSDLPCPPQHSKQLNSRPPVVLTSKVSEKAR